MTSSEDGKFGESALDSDSGRSQLRSNSLFSESGDVKSYLSQTSASDANYQDAYTKLALPRGKKKLTGLNYLSANYRFPVVYATLFQQTTPAQQPILLKTQFEKIDELYWSFLKFFVLEHLSAKMNSAFPDDYMSEFHVKSMPKSKLKSESKPHKLKSSKLTEIIEHKTLVARFGLHFSWSLCGRLSTNPATGQVKARRSMHD